MTSLTVATVLRSGGSYGPEWVWALRRGLNRHLPVPFRFVCLSDVEGLGMWRIPLQHDFPNWWAKMELWRPGVFGGRVLYLDLDTLVVGDLSEIASYDGPLAVLSDFYRPEWPASGVMAWTPSAETEAIYHAFRAVAEEGAYRPGRRSDFFLRDHLPEHDRLQALFPGQIVSLKVHALDGPPEDARLVCGHGKPALSDPRAGWAHEAWCDLSREAAA